MKPFKSLKKLLGKKTLLIPGVFNGASALLAEAAGFKAVYISGAGVSNALAGLPDKSLIPMELMALQGGLITEVISVPALADADTGFGDIRKTVAFFESAGISAIQIEDQLFPKRCGHLPGKELVTEKVMADKIRKAVRARKNPDFMIVARTDARGVAGMDDAIRRAGIYLEAGADMIFPEALTSREEFKTFAREIRTPLLANMTEFGRTPYLTLQEFEKMGYAAVIFPMTAFRVMMAAGKEAFGFLKKNGGQEGILKKMQTRRELYKLLKYAKY